MIGFISPNDSVCEKLQPPSVLSPLKVIFADFLSETKVKEKTVFPFHAFCKRSGNIVIQP